MDPMEISMNSSSEPMDVDISSTSNNRTTNRDEADFSRHVAAVPNYLQQPEIISKENKFPNLLLKPSPRAFAPVPRKKSYATIKYLILTFLSGYLSVLLVQINSIKCVEDFNYQDMASRFQNNIFGQDNAVKQILLSLEVEAPAKLLVIYGGTGVGKSLATSLLFENQWNHSNVYHYTMPSFNDTFSTNLLFGLIMCKTAAIVVDDLNYQDMDLSASVIEIVDKAKKLERNVTIILVYNCYSVNSEFGMECPSKFVGKLQETYSTVEAHKKYIKFEPLEQEHLIQCIEKEMGPNNKQHLNMKDVLKNFDVKRDGCKGVHTKMKFLNIV